MQRILEQTIIHTTVTESLNSGWGMVIVRLCLAEALNNQTVDGSICTLSLFNLIYVSVKDLRVLVQICVMLYLIRLCPPIISVQIYIYIYI